MCLSDDRARSIAETSKPCRALEQCGAVTNRYADDVSKEGLAKNRWHVRERPDYEGNSEETRKIREADRRADADAT